MKKAVIAGLLGAISLTGCVNPKVELHLGDTDKPIIITDYYQVSPNGAGGVKLYLTAFNMINKPIKYFDFWTKHYDRVGEVSINSINGKTLSAYRFTGPYLKEKSIDGQFGPSFYNYSAYCMMLEKVEVTYMDNSKKIFNSEQLNNVIVSSGPRCRNITRR